MMSIRLAASRIGTLSDTRLLKGRILGALLPEQIRFVLAFMWKLISMCNLGVVWSLETEDALSALRGKKEYMATVRNHAGWKLDEGAAWIIFTELVTNVVHHAPGHIRIILECINNSIFLAVIDQGPGFEFDPKLPSSALAEGGRGLFVISQFATDVRVERLPHEGSRVVAKLPTQLDLVT
jgi:anti-sigma regulatory factor (Ser/Thr protein kinase)